MHLSGGMNNFLLQRGRKLVAGIHCALRQTSVMIATTSVTFGLDCRLLVCLGLTLEAGPLLTSDRLAQIESSVKARFSGATTGKSSSCRSYPHWEAASGTRVKRSGLSINDHTPMIFMPDIKSTFCSDDNNGM